MFVDGGDCKWEGNAEINHLSAEGGMCVTESYHLKTSDKTGELQGQVCHQEKALKRQTCFNLVRQSFSSYN